MGAAVGSLSGVATCRVGRRADRRVDRRVDRRAARCALALLLASSGLASASAQRPAAPGPCAAAPAAETEGAVGTGTLSREGARLVYRVAPAPLAVGRPFAIRACAEVGVAGAASLPRRIRFDAQMPQHGHGMNYQPSVVDEGGGWYRFEGSVLHMPGRWQLVFDVFDDTGRRRLTTDVDVGR